MKQLSSMLSVLFAGLFWVFRVVLAYTSATGKDLGFPIQDFTVEVILLFVVLILLVLIYKRKLLAGIIYFLLYIFIITVHNRKKDPLAGLNRLPKGLKSLKLLK